MKGSFGCSPVVRCACSARRRSIKQAPPWRTKAKLPASAEQPRTVPPRRAVPFSPNSGKGVGAGPQASAADLL